MSTVDVDKRISSFLGRKHAEYPDLADSGRHDSRTIKYALELRNSGQLPLDR
jgi:hypothetical protein